MVYKITAPLHVARCRCSLKRVVSKWKPLVNETIKVYHVILLLFVQNCGNFKESRFGWQVEAMQEFFRNLVVSLHLSSSLFSFQSLPHQTVISISSSHTLTMSSFDYLISKNTKEFQTIKLLIDFFIVYAFYQTDSRTVWASDGCAKQTGSSRGCVRRRRRFDNSWFPFQTALLQLMFLFLSNSNHILMSRDALFRCLSAGRVYANAHRSRVLAQGPLVLSSTR